MQKFLSICGLLAVIGFVALPARANVFPDPFTPVPIPQVVQPLPFGPPLFNIARPFVVTQFRWQIVTVPMAGQPAPFVFLVDTLSGTSFLLHVDQRQPAGYSWQLLDFD